VQDAIERARTPARLLWMMKMLPDPCPEEVTWVFVALEAPLPGVGARRSPLSSDRPTTAGGSRISCIAYTGAAGAGTANESFERRSLWLKFMTALSDLLSKGHISQTHASIWLFCPCIDLPSLDCWRLSRWCKRKDVLQELHETFILLEALSMGASSPSTTTGKPC